jgi:hypothetical protein
MGGKLFLYLLERQQLWFYPVEPCVNIGKSKKLLTATPTQPTQLSESRGTALPLARGRGIAIAPLQMRQSSH